MQLGDVLTVSHFTLIGATRGAAPRTPFVERIAAAAAAGFAGIGWRLDDHDRELRAGNTLTDLVAALESHQLRVTEFEALYDWWCDDERSTASRDTEARLLEVAGAIGARALTACDIREPDGTFDLAIAAERFGRVCDRSAAVGVHVNLEFLPWSSVPDAPTAYEIVRRADRPNGGLLVDSWHVFRGAGIGSLVSIPGERITGIQLNDADRERRGAWLEDTTRRRRLPGDGAFDLVGLLRLLQDLGTRCPVAVEVLSDELNRRPTDEAARLAHDSTRRVLDAALVGPSATGTASPPKEG